MDKQVDNDVFKEVSKEEFRQIYVRLGGGPRTGWTLEYWQTFFENQADRAWRFMVKEPQTPEHHCMMIVSDHETKEYRLFFMTEEATEQSFDFPGKE